MLATIEKAKPNDRARAERLLAIGARSIRSAFIANVTAATAPASVRAARELLDAGKLDAATALLMDRFVGNVANAFAQVFIDTASAEVAALNRKIVTKAPTIGFTFNVADERAVRLMQANRLSQITRLTRSQQQAVRAALVRSIREELGTAEMTRLLQRAIGLAPTEQRRLELIETGQRTARLEALAVPEGERGPVMSPKQIDEMIEREADKALRTRAELIGRTESLRVVSQSRDLALRQSIEATGIRREHVIIEWASTHDARTRSAHAARDGMRVRLGEPFAPGIYKPGDGDASESLNCRCTALYHIGGTDEEADKLLRVRS